MDGLGDVTNVGAQTGRSTISSRPVRSGPEEPGPWSREPRMKRAAFGLRNRAKLLV